MASGNLELRTSIATPSDFQRISRLCRRSTGRSDYVLWALRETIKHRGLFLAWSSDELVGMTNFGTCVDGSGWLSMARTDPDWRRKGVALFLQRKIARHAMQRGIRVLRLWALANNTASKRACLKGGFKPVCEAAHISTAIRKSRRGKRIPPLRTASESAVRSLASSSSLAKMRGYHGYKWHIVKSSKELLRKFVGKREVYEVEDVTFILTRPERRFRMFVSNLTLLSGPIAESLRTAKELARSMGAQRLGSYVPYDAYILRTAKRAGFVLDDWGNHCIAFEKTI